MFRHSSIAAPAHVRAPVADTCRILPGDKRFRLEFPWDGAKTLSLRANNAPMKKAWMDLLQATLCEAKSQIQATGSVFAYGGERRLHCPSHQAFRLLPYLFVLVRARHSRPRRRRHQHCAAANKTPRLSVLEYMCGAFRWYFVKCVVQLASVRVLEVRERLCS